MKSGYKIIWSEHAIAELNDTYNYLKKHWTLKEIKTLSKDLDRILNLILIYPDLFPISTYLKARKVTIRKFNTLFYKVVDDNKIVIIAFFSNRQEPLINSTN